MMFLARAALLAGAFLGGAAPAFCQTYTLSKFQLQVQGTGSKLLSFGLTDGGTIYGALQSTLFESDIVFSQPLGGQLTSRRLATFGTIFDAVRGNDVGQFAGTLILHHPRSSLFLSTAQSLSTFGPFYGDVVGLDNSGDLAAFAYHKGDYGYALLRSGTTGKIRDLKVSGAQSTFPSGMNNNFAVVGCFNTALDRNCQGFLYQNGVVASVTGPGGAFATPLAINDSGEILLESGTTYYILDGGNYTQMAVPGAVQTNTYGINNAGATYGMYSTADEVSHAFVWKNGVYTTISAPTGLEIGGLSGLDDAGDVVGYWSRSPGGPSTPFVGVCSGPGC